MRTFAINTLGCKVNQYESQQIRQVLEDFSLFQVQIDEKPDLIVVNTCCVTHIASAKSRQNIRKLRRLNPGSKIIVAGCLPAGPNAELGDFDHDTIIIDDKSRLFDELKSFLSKNIAQLHESAAPDSTTPGLTSYSGQTRAFLKVQDGCDGFCSYCIVPKIRSTIYNKPAEQVIAEARNLVYAGHGEIVLTGIFLGAYGQTTVRRKHWTNDTGFLPDLIDKVAQVPGLKRLRLSSLEPADVTDSLLDVMCAHENIMPHLHLPLQSGSPAILKKMCRQYNADEFRQMIEKVNSRLDRPAITTDIIVGFPTEADEDFQQTMQMAQFAQFSKIHVFSYSQRKDTAAVNMNPKVPPQIITERSKTLRRLDAELGHKFRLRFAGEKISAIIESTNPHQGRSERYFMVQFLNAPSSIKQGDFVHGQLDKTAVKAQIFM